MQGLEDHLQAFFCNAVLQLPHEVSCLGKEEIWTAERERGKKKNKKANPQQKPKPFSCQHLLEEKIVVF